MEIIKYDEVKNTWKQIARNKNSADDFSFEIEVYKRLLGYFHVGQYYFYILNIAEQKMEFVSESVKTVRGIDPQDFTLDYVVDRIHPEDFPYFAAFEKKVASFFNALTSEQVLKYKVSYDYRSRKSDGSYMRVLQQTTTIQTDETGAVIRVLGVQTDITHLKKEKLSTLSFIGLEDEPSFIDIAFSKVFLPSNEILTKREKQILKLMAEGKNSITIADELSLSKNTIITHRKNMLRKTDLHTTMDLVMKAMIEGWI